jgi:DNA-3-methyladenine glycosylase
MPILPRRFFARDVLQVAPELVGKHLVRGPVTLRITEVEAYRWPPDTACHARSGKTARNAPLWGPPGRAYVYLCYGLHNMLNLVTGDDGSAQAVLVRSCAPVRGLDVVRKRRDDKSGPVLLTGPGKVGQALGLDTAWSHHPLYRPGGLTLRDGPPPAALLVGPRVGIDYAQPEHRVLPWRFAEADSPWVTRPRELHPRRANVGRHGAPSDPRAPSP